MPWWPWYLLAINPVLVQTAGVVTGASVAAAVTWFLGRRNTSGSVTTSTAADLWAASDSLRRDLTDALSAERDARQTDRVRFEADLQVERGERLRLEGALAAEVKERHRVEDVNRELTERVAVLERQASGT